MSDTAIQQRLMEACVLIMTPDGDFGTGYVIAHGLVGTAAHVVDYWGDDVSFPVEVGWGPTRHLVQAKVIGRDKSADAAILALISPRTVEPIPIGGRPPDKSAWEGFGFPKVASLNPAPTGVTLSGRILNASWFHPRGQQQLLLHCDQVMTRASIHGASGSAVVVDGALVGHIVEQFTNPADRTQAILGQIKVCPIQAVLALLPPGAKLRRVQSRAPTAEADISELFSWCDREAVTSCLKDWLDTYPPGATGVLCMVAHSENREGPLLDRVAKELSEQKPNRILSNAVQILKEIDPDKPQHFRRTVLGCLDVERDELVHKSGKFRGMGGLVLLCHTCNLQRGTAKEVEKRIAQASQWLSGLSLGKRRLVIVLVFSFDDTGLTSQMETKVRKAMAAAKKLHGAMVSLSNDKPIVLSDYKIEHFRRWIALPVVRSSLGRAVSQVEDSVLADWHWNKELSHGALLQKIKKSQLMDH